VLAGDVEVLDVVALMVAIAEDAAAGLTEREKLRQCWLKSERGFMRVSMMLSLMGCE